MLVHVLRLGIHLQLALNKIFAVSTHFLSHKDCQSSIAQILIAETIFLTSPALLTLYLLTNAWFSYMLDAVPKLCQLVAFQKYAMLTPPQLKNQDIFQIQTSRERLMPFNGPNNATVEKQAPSKVE